MIDFVIIPLIRLLANIELSVYVIVSFFLVSAIGMVFLSHRAFFRGLANNAPSLLTSLGITFTFMGVLRGLLDFDLNNIDVGITELLEGLKVAFISSVMGISLAFIFRLIQLNLRPAGAGADLADIMREGFHDISQAIGGDQESSMVSQLEALQHSFDNKINQLIESFREFTQEVVDKGSEALLEALTGVIEDFNTKINDQLGNNFMRFNEAVSELVAWQEKNRLEMDGIVTSLGKVQSSLEIAVERITEISSETGKIPEHLAALNQVQKAFEEEMGRLHSGLASLADMRVQAQEALPALERGLREVIVQMQSGHDTALTSIKDASSTQQSATGEMLEQMESLRSETAKVLVDGTTTITTISEGLEQTIINAQNSLRMATEESIATISMAIQQLDTSMQEEVQRCVETMGRNVTRVTEEFVNQYERLARASDK